MIKLKDVKINAEATLGTPLLLCRINPTYMYSEGVPTSTRDGTRYTVAAPGCGMATIGVKVPGPQTVDLEGKAYLPVTFEGMELYVYHKDTKPMVGARATAIHLASKA